MNDQLDLETRRALHDHIWMEKQGDYADPLKLRRAIAVLEALWLVNRRSPHFLDVGCSNGWLSGILGQFGPVTAVYFSSVGIERAKRQHPDVTFVAGDLHDLRLPAGPFDVVVSIPVMGHLTNHRQFLDSAARSLAPGGHIILIAPNPWNVVRWDPAAYRQFSGAEPPLEDWLSLRKIRALLEPRFQILRLTTLLPGSGHRGILRVLHSVKLAALLQRVRLLRGYHALLSWLGCGLLIFAVAKLRDGAGAPASPPAAAQG